MKTSHIHKRRDGISLFEVLVSILVASIGVFGVLVLIPFAVKSAERGIDGELAINTAKNFNADFQAFGYHNPSTWFDDVRDTQVLTPLAPAVSPTLPPVTSNNITNGMPFIIDPVTAVQNLNTTGTFGQFPALPLPDDVPRLNIVSLFQPTPSSTASALDVDLARRLALSSDELVFKRPEEELEPPRQEWFTIDGITAAKRQYAGRYSTIAFVIPDDDEGLRYRMITIVGKPGDRNAERVFEVIDPNAAAGGAPAAMRMQRLDLAPLATRGYEQIGLGGGDLRLSEIPTGGQPSLAEDQIRNNDWMMLVSYNRLDPDPAVDALHDDIQINFFRVIHADRASPNPDAPVPILPEGCNRGAGAERTFDVTLQGPDMDLYRDWFAKVDGQRTDVPTYAVLIPNVLAVYERTFQVESSSPWNLSR